MIKKQLSEARKLITEQWQATLGKKIDKQRAKTLADQHFFEIDRENTEPSHHIDFTKKTFQHIENAQHRMIFVCLKFKICDAGELSHQLKIARSTVWMIYKKYKNSEN